ncbi:Hsp20 family protein [Spartinivicinus poritis]|uniref:Hsp20 family protein n=1 Tax=Spartinivicinus poritis TaxID=2994640 RepID=A0ABT5UH93_9GAMM|nr:Hsp20 family protein [Spartinivicinus sp. A2-2]MDE1465741.1 Hsp20 family protein [Spartinivicinus sp. A2-2]
MTTFDLSPLYRSSIGFDQLASALDSALRSDQTTPGYPPYNIEALDENHYGITLAVAGFEESELDIQVEKGVLTISGKKAKNKEPHKYLYQGIATRSFERKFNLADYVEVTEASLVNGLLSISLKREVPEAMKPKSIPITQGENKVIEHQKKEDKAA